MDSLHCSVCRCEEEFRAETICFQWVACTHRFSKEEALILMNDIAGNNHIRRNHRIQVMLLTLALLTSPALCCGGVQLLDSLPASWLPASLNFSINLFEGTARVENKTAQTLYITAITTTYGNPRVIPQNIAFRQRDIPLESHRSLELHYDSADLPLSGIAVCKSAEDCRLLPVDNSDVYEVNSYESLGPLEPGWLQVIQLTPLHNYSTLVIVGLSLVSICLFSSWVYLRGVKRNPWDNKDQF
jgi:hypothetical protein